MWSTLINPLTILLFIFVLLETFKKDNVPPSDPVKSIRKDGTSPTVTTLQYMQSQRIATIFDALRPPISTNDISTWIQTLDADGRWPDKAVNYTVGCNARRANWPAQVHWERILRMAATWHGDPTRSAGGKYIGDASLQKAISRAMDYWFQRDLTNLQCIHAGGQKACPCDDLDKTFWNTNWFANVILVPRAVGQTCLLLNTTTLTEYQVGKCKEMTSRSYNLFGQPFTFLEGANVLDIARLGIDGALLTSNVTLISDAYHRIHQEAALKSDIKDDGIRHDGSFGQHKGLLYNGNYGKDFINGMVDVELTAVGTSYAASADIRASFETLISGSQWMTIRNVLTQTTHWDLSVLSRILVFPLAELQATLDLGVIIPSLGELGNKWGSSVLTSFVSAASKNSTSANAGDLVGNRHFHANDYMVHRGANYVSTVKTYSSRTLNSECTNTQNPLGFHLSDNAVRTYVRGDEYEDIAAAWDWYLIPGATIDYGGTPLNCSTIKVTGMEDFVGGVSDGTLGISVMRYTNPLTKALRWQKAWFFLHDDVQHTMLSNLSSVSNSSSIRTVLEQRRQRGPIVLDGQEVSSTTATQAATLWHGDIGYIFSNFTNAGRLVVDSKQATGNWASIGTSTQHNTTVRLFSAWVEHSQPSTPLSYTILPGISQRDFGQKRERLKIRTLQNDNEISAILDEANSVIYAVFWQPSGGRISFQRKGLNAESITITAQHNIALIYKADQGEIVVSDPSQKLKKTVITLARGNMKQQLGLQIGVPPGSTIAQIDVDFPAGGMSGRSVVHSIA